MRFDTSVSALSSAVENVIASATSTPTIADLLFFRTVMKAIRKQIAGFGDDLLGGMTSWAGGVALVLMTLWLIVQGYRIVTGQSRDSMAALVTNMTRAAFLVTLATSMSLFGTDIKMFVVEGLHNEIGHVVTGKSVAPSEQIDDALKKMQAALAGLDAIQLLDDPGLAPEKTKAQLLIGVGSGGPAIVGGAMLLTYEVALQLFIGFGPLFILCLLFEQTKSLFSKWLFYGLGTLFSMAVLAAMVSIAMKMVVAITDVFWTGELLELLLGGGGGLTSQAFQHGGLGLILTVLIVTAPPMAAYFFQGTLGSITAYPQMGSVPQGAGAGGPKGMASATAVASSPSDIEGGAARVAAAAREASLISGTEAAVPMSGRYGNAER